MSAERARVTRARGSVSGHARGLGDAHPQAGSRWPERAPTHRSTERPLRGSLRTPPVERAGLAHNARQTMRAWLPPPPTPAAVVRPGHPPPRVAAVRTAVSV